jgi:hypothetical protein
MMVGQITAMTAITRDDGDFSLLSSTIKNFACDTASSLTKIDV